MITCERRLLQPEEVEQLAAECENAWKDERIPARQYDIASTQLDIWRKGGDSDPFNAVLRCMLPIANTGIESLTLLDVGAAGGYYSEVLKQSSVPIIYTALDYSPAFKLFAEKIYPGISYFLGDARALPFADNSFDCVLSGCCIVHILDYEAVIRETARVASNYAIFSKTPVHDEETAFYENFAYGVRCLEICFEEDELLGLFERYGLQILATEAAGSNCVTYLLRKTSRAEREWERA